MNLRSRLSLFAVLLTTIAMLVVGVTMYKFSEKSLINSSLDNLTQVRIRKHQVLRTEFEQISHALINQSNQQSTKKAVTEMAESKRLLYSWLRQQSSEKEWRKELNQVYQAQNDTDNQRLINRLMAFPLYVQSQFIQESISSGKPRQAVSTVKKRNDQKFFRLYSDLYASFKDVTERHSLDDALLIDSSGTLLFSLQKNLDLGVNLITGPLNSTSLSEAFRWAVTATPHTVKFFDFSKPPSSAFKPVAYFVSPLYEKNKFLGAVVFQFSQQRLNTLISDNNEWKENGLKETGEVVVFGEDGYIRSNSRLLVQNPQRFETALMEHTRNPQMVKDIISAKTAALEIKLPRRGIDQLFNDETSRRIDSDYLGIKNLRSSGRFSLPGGEQWILIAKMEYAEVVRPLKWTSKITFLIGLLLTALILPLTHWLSKNITHPLKALSLGFDELDQHQTTKKISYPKDDEMGELVNKFNYFSEAVEKTTVSKDFLDGIIQSINEFLFVTHLRYNPQTKQQYLSISSVNKAAADALGLSVHSLNGTNISNWLEADLSPLLSSNANDEDSANLFHSEGLLKTNRGEKIPIAISWAKIKKNPYGSQGLVIVCSDMRWKREAEQAITLKENLLRETQSLTKSGAFYWNTNNQESKGTEEIFGILGIDPQTTTPLYTLVRSVIIPEDLPIFDRALDDTHTNINPLNVDVRIRRGNSHELAWIRCMGRVEYDDYGNASSMFGVVQDITAQKRTEQTLIAAKDDALKSSHAKSEFLARMSHEIRTPMNAIMGMAELLRETKLNKDQEYYITIFCKAGEVLMSLINDILDISKIEAGEVSIENIPFDLRKLLNDVQDMIRPKSLEKGIDFSFEVGPGISSFLMGDPTKVRQILINLVSNSVKFTERGSIRVKVIKNPTKKDNLIFSVTDSGLGIPSSTQHLIFQKFSQADSTITRKYGGTGLGLAISKSLVELMGGQIWFKSREGLGTTFFFTIPYREQFLNPTTQKPLELKASTLDFAQTPPRDPNKKVRILLADDTEDNRTLFIHYLKNGPYEIIEADNGLDAVNKIKSNKFDIVFMDVQMPEMDGYAATAAIREWEQENHLNPLPIIALTAHALSDDRQKSLRVGCNDHVTKPFKKDTLLGVINRYSL
ncbi:Autoinducer 2 sensor kinase/phosphatase LuxQ [compost metagenome]